jgi:hypothetical protein
MHHPKLRQLPEQAHMVIPPLQLNLSQLYKILRAKFEAIPHPSK